MAKQRLTLGIESEIVNQAKLYAKKNHISLSKLIQDYLDELSKPEPETNIPQEILKLRGILKDKLPDDIDLEEERYQ